MCGLAIELRLRATVGIYLLVGNLLGDFGAVLDGLTVRCRIWVSG